MIPVFRMYLALQTAATSNDNPFESADLTSFDLPTDFFRRSYRGGGSPLAPPFYCLEVGFEVQDYDVAVFEQQTKLFFSILSQYSKSFSVAVKSHDTRSELVINMNARTELNRPVCYLDAENVALIAQFGASIAFDGY